MKLNRQQREYLLQLLLQAHSLYALLDILRNISERIKLEESNRTKEFYAFRFTFFGLIVKIDSLLSLMLFRCEYLSTQQPAFIPIYKELRQLRSLTQSAYEHIRKRHVAEGRKQIIAAAKRYEHINEHLQEFHKRLVEIEQ